MKWTKNLTVFAAQKIMLHFVTPVIVLQNLVFAVQASIEHDIGTSTFHIILCVIGINLFMLFKSYDQFFKQ